MLVLGMSDTNISTAYQHANTQANKITYYAAEACIEEAMQRLEEDVSFTSTTLQLDSNTSCSVTVSGSGPYTIATTVTLLDYTQNYQATAEITASGEANNIDLQSWKKY